LHRNSGAFPRKLHLGAVGFRSKPTGDVDPIQTAALRGKPAIAPTGSGSGTTHEIGAEALDGASVRCSD
jgi:hypothetical protein